MKIQRYTVVLALLAGLWSGLTPAWGVNKEMVQLQTQVQDLQDRIAHMQQSFDERMGVMQHLIEQSTDRANKVAASVTDLQTTLQKQQKDYYTDLDGRLKKFEPQQQTVDGVQGTVQPGETEAFNAASTQFRSGDFKNAAASFKTFVAKYPQSPYQPTAQYWLGNAQ